MAEAVYTGLTDENVAFLEYLEEEHAENVAYIRTVEEVEEEWDKLFLVRGIAHKEQHWLVDGLIPEGDVTFFTGDFGSFKSYLSWFLADAVDRGEPFLDRATRQHPVLILDLENSHATISLRRDKIGRLREPDSKVRFMGKFSTGTVPRAFPFTGAPDAYKQTEEVYKEYKKNQIAFGKLLKICKYLKPVIILDSFGDFHPGLDENSADDMTVFMRRLLQLVEAGSPAVIALHHVPKNTEGGRGSTYRGSTAIPALAGCMLQISKKGATSVQIQGIKNRDGEDHTIKLALQFGANSVSYRIDHTEELLHQEIRERYEAGETQTALAKAFNMSQPTISRIVKK